MDSQFAPTDVVVVGGGMAGLSAACYLARAGIVVTLFEKASRVGGRAATQTYEGYCFNRGIHALYTGGAASRVLQELGITYSGHRPQATFGLQQGKLQPLPADLLTLVRSDLLDVGDKLEAARLFLALPRLQPQTLAYLSVQAWLERTIRRLQVRRVLAALARTFVYSAALDLVSAEVFIDKLQRSFKHPVHYIDGGWQTLVDALHRAAEQAGARIVSGARVAAIEHQDGRVQGVRLRDGSLLHASAIIIATSPQDAAKLVDDGTSPALRHIVDALIPAQLACLDVALCRLPDSRYPVVQDLDRPRFLSTQSLYARITPPGGALIHTFKQLDPRQPTDPRMDERELEDLLDTVQPGWRDVLVKRVYLPRIEAIGMLPTASGGGFAGRPGSQVPGLAGLYLAGDWIGAEGFLVDASMASARQVAHLILQDNRASSHTLVVGSSK